jgi:hypothetical protein
MIRKENVGARSSKFHETLGTKSVDKIKGY